MKRSITYLSCLFLAILLISSCDGVLDVEPNGLTVESNYYQTPEQAFAALVAAYNPVGMQTGGPDNTYVCLLGGLNAATGNMYAGGGGPSDMLFWQSWDNYDMSGGVGPQGGYWARSYTGIYRVNLLLQKIDGVKGFDEATKARYIAEAKFLRGYYYFWLIRLFKNVPLFTEPLETTEIYDVKQAPPDSVYAQIIADFTAAIPDLPSAPLPLGERGRATKGAARAFLAKTLMWQVGEGQNQSKMQRAADLLNQVNTSASYELVANYPDIFSPENEFHSGSIFTITHTSKQQADWGMWNNFRGNIYVQMIGPRGYAGYKYNSGYGFNTITTKLVNAMDGDPRAKHTILNADSLVNAGVASYQAGYRNTGYFVQKFAPQQEYAATSGIVALNYPNNYIEVRLAGTYLLEAEAIIRSNGDMGRAAFLLNEVRARVGLPAIAATLENVYHEMWMELATEGHRWFHLVRTGRAATELADVGFKDGINEILPIPLESLNNTALVQNPGYE